MGENEVEFDFEPTLDGAYSSKELPSSVSQQNAARKNFKKTVCRYWLKNLCMKGNSCSFLHQYDPDRMPVCRYFAKHGVCKEEDCPYSHSTDGVKECNMFNIGFCIHGPNCMFKHVKRPPPAPSAQECALIGTPGYRWIAPHKRPRADKEPHAYEALYGDGTKQPGSTTSEQQQSYSEYQQQQQQSNHYSGTGVHSSRSTKQPRWDQQPQPVATAPAAAASAPPPPPPPPPQTAPPAAPIQSHQHNQQAVPQSGPPGFEQQ